MKFSVQDLYDTYGLTLGLKMTKAKEGMDCLIKVSHVERPGLSLAGYIREKANRRLLVFGKMELSYLEELEGGLRKERLQGVVTEKTPAVIVSRSLVPPKELIALCIELKIPLFRTKEPSMSLISQLTRFLSDQFAPTQGVHGTLVEIYGIGVLISGDSSVGKSEAALGLIERGHRLISDDVVELKIQEGGKLLGSGPELNRHLLELRGIGIVNVAHLFGAVSVRKEVPVDLVVHLEEWDETHYYDRIGLEERFTEFLGVKVPLYVHPVKPGRDIVLLIEIAVLNHRLKETGYHSAKEFNVKLLEEIARKKRVGKKG